MSEARSDPRHPEPGRPGADRRAGDDRDLLGLRELRLQDRPLRAPQLARVDGLDRLHGAEDQAAGLDRRDLGHPAAQAVHGGEDRIRPRPHVVRRSSTWCSSCRACCSPCPTASAARSNRRPHTACTTKQAHRQPEHSPRSTAMQATINGIRMNYDGRRPGQGHGRRAAPFAGHQPDALGRADGGADAALSRGAVRCARPRQDRGDRRRPTISRR